MSEGVFSIAADIVPQLDERQLQTQAQNLIKQFNSLLAKEVKPVQIAANTKGLEQSQGFLSRIINQLTVMERGTNAVTRAVTGTANAFDIATKNAVGLAQRGVRPIIDNFEKLHPAVTKTFQSISAIGGTAFNTARAGILQFTNALNLTSTNILGYAGNIRKAIQENTRFKDGLDFIKRSGDSLKNLPQTFSNVQAQVIAGVSPLQRAAEAGSGFARSLIPFLLIGVSVAREIGNISSSLNRVVEDLKIFKNATLDFEQQFPAAAKANAKEAERVKEAFADLIKTASSPEIKDKLINAFTESDKTALGLRNTLKRLRDEFPELKNQINKTLGPLDTSNFDKLSSKIDTVKTKFQEGTEEAKKAAEAFSKTDVGNTVRGVASTVTGGPGFRPTFGPPTPVGLTDLFTPDEQKSNKFLNELFPQSRAAKLVSDIKAKINTAAQSGGFLTKIIQAFKDESGSTNVTQGIAGGFVGAFKKVGETAKDAASGGLGIFKGLMGQVTNSVGLGSIAGVGLIGVISGIGLAALNAAGKFQTMQVALDGIFGKGTGKQALQDIAQFAAVTPFRLEDAAQAVIKLSSAFQGLDTKGALAILSQFSGAAAAVGATGDAINRVILGFTQIQAAGKLTADNVRQITEALPNISQGAIIANLAKEMGVTADQARNLYHQGLVPVTEGLKAIVDAANQVPGADKALENQSKTFQGLLSTLQDNTQQFLAAIGGPILTVAVGVFTALNDVLSVLIPTMAKLGDIGGSIVGFLQDFVDRFRELGGAAKFVADHIIELGVALAALSGNPLILAIAGIGLIAKQMNDASKATQDTTNSTKSATEAFNEAQRALDPLTRSLDAFVTALASGNTAAIGKALSDFTEAQKASADALQDSEISVLKTTLGLKSAFDAQKKASEAVTDAQTRLNDAIKQHDEELATKTIDLTNKLNDARDHTTEANDKVAESQAKLNELLKGASAEDLEKGDLALAQAKLRLRQIIEDEKKAQDELNASQQTAVDLTGLTVDQIKSRLSVARAALAAQKQTQDAIKNTKTPEQKSIDTASDAITRREAELAVLDATKAVEDLRTKGSEKDPEIIAARQAVAAAEKDAAKAKQDQLDAQTALDKLKGPDAAWTKEKAGLEKDIANSKQTARDADRDAAIAVAEAKGDKKEIIRLLGDEIAQTPGLTKVLEDTTVPEKTRKALANDLGIKFTEIKQTIQDTIPIAQKLTDAINLALAAGNLTVNQANVLKLKLLFQALKPGELPTGRPDVDQFIHDILGQTANGKSVQDLVNKQVQNLLDKVFGGGKNLAPEAKTLFTNEAIKAAVLTLAEGAKSQDEINNAIKAALQKIPGVGPVNFAQGGVVDKATPGVFGEAGIEAILPLTRPMRLADILSHPQVLPPVLDALDRIALPSARNTMPTLETQPMTADLSGIRMVRSGPQIPLHHEQAKRDRALAKAIVEEMQDAGMIMGQTTVNNQFVAPDSNDPLAKLKADQIAREVKRQIEKLL